MLRRLQYSVHNGCCFLEVCTHWDTESFVTEGESIEIQMDHKTSLGILTPPVLCQYFRLIKNKSKHRCAFYINSIVTFNKKMRRIYAFIVFLFDGFVNTESGYK